MLGVTFTSRAALEEGEERRKKDKKEKKKKKEKRGKQEKRDKRAVDNSSGDSGSDGNNDVRRGPSPNSRPGDIHGQPATAKDADTKSAAAAEEPTALQREDWMTRHMQREPSKAAVEAAAEEREEEERRRKEAEAEIVAGLRIMKKPDTAAGAAPTPPAAGAGAGAGTAPSPGGGGGRVGDGGASWRLKALRRAQEQARAEGRSLQEVVGERWGSLAQLTGELTATVAADGRAHLRAAAERRRAAESGVPLPHYLQDVRSDRAKMMRPADDASLSWRRDRDRDRDRDNGRGQRDDRPPGRDDGPDREGPGRGRDDGDGQRARERDRERPGGDRRGGGEERPTHGSERDRDRGGRSEGRDQVSEPVDRRGDGGRPGGERLADGACGGTDAGGGGGARAPARDQDGDRDRHRDRVSERDRNTERDWERNRDPSRDRDSERDRDRRRDRDRDPERDRGRERTQERDRQRPDPRVGPRPSREQAAALQQLAGSLNTFVDDGSFLDRFMAAQGKQQRGAGQTQGPNVKVQEDVEEEEGSRGTLRGDLVGDGDGGGGDGGRQQRRQGEGRREERGPSDGGASAGMDVDEGTDPRVGRGAPGGGGAGPAGPGPSSARSAAATATAATGGGNRGVAALLRARAGGAATAVPAGGAASGGSREEEAEELAAGQGAAPSTAPRRAPLFVGDGGEEGGGGGGGGGVANKSAAELLRARLKGLKPPSIAGGGGGGGCAAGAVKAEPEDADAAGSGGAAKRGARGGSDEGSGDDGGGGVGAPRREVVALPLVDSAGRAVRGAFGREAAGAGAAAGAGRRAGAKPPQRYNPKTGEKERYFADDDKVDLQTMLRRAKYGDDDMDMDEHLAANIAKKRKFRGTDLDVDAEYDYDGGLEMYESRAKRGGAEAQRSRERSRQVADLRRQAAAEAGCGMCITNPHRPQHLTISIGHHAYLSLPARGRLLRGHVCIAPAEHCPSIRGLDEATWTEVKNFIKCLIQMYGSQGQSVLFMETYMTRGGPRNHAVLDAIPVTERQLEKARGYFKKAILEAESEWSTHHAKACIDTTAQKGLRESIPPNFPYFFVQFGYGSGYVHVIDNETKFDPNFGRQVLIGLLDLPPEMAYQRHKAESAATQQQWVREFESQWDPFDWTRKLHQA